MSGPSASAILNTDRDVTIWAPGNERHVVICNGEEHIVTGRARGLGFHRIELGMVVNDRLTQHSGNGAVNAG